LSWLIGGVALLFYWSTLCQWLSLYSLSNIASVADWTGKPELVRPLTLLVFGPLRVLPDTWLPLTANIVTATIAALVLMQLTRSVSILRVDLVSADPMRKKVSGASILTGKWSWLPPVVAAMALGWQLGFWQHASSASGEMLSLLCFAFAFRGVFEFRVQSDEKWLYRAAFVFALGITDNWLMLGYLPLFVAAVIWVKGLTPFLSWRFFWRMCAWGLAGLALYGLSPLVLYFSEPETTEFLATLKNYVAAQKFFLKVLLKSSAFRLLVITGILPFLLLAVRWRSHSAQLADDTHLGLFFTKASGHFIHAMFLLTALWIALNPTFIPSLREVNSALLPYAYSWALVAGYCVAYLLVFGLPRPRKSRAKWPAVVAMSLSVALAGTLLWKNFPEVRLSNSRMLEEYATHLRESLPAGAVTALSDETLPLILLRASGKMDRDATTPMLVDARLLGGVAYHEKMHRQYGDRWPDWPLTNNTPQIAPAMQAAVISQIASNETVVYLHPSSGLFFERFTAVPQGWIFRLTPRDKMRVADPTTALQESNERWQSDWHATLAHRARQFEASRTRVTRWTSPEWKFLKLSARLNETVVALSGPLSKTLNTWGVKLQQSGVSSDAAEWFERALEFDPDNLAAHLNREAARRRAVGDTNILTMQWARATIPSVVSKYATWTDVIHRNGPVDEAAFLLLSGRLYFATSHPWQAHDCFARSRELQPDWLAPKLWQAQSLNLAGDYVTAAALTEQVLATETNPPATMLGQILESRTVALLGLGQMNEAIEFINSFATPHQATDQVVVTAAELCQMMGNLPEELKWREMLAQRDPKRVDWLVKKGSAEVRAKQNEAAIATLTSALSVAPTNALARHFRGIAALRMGQLDLAQRDFETLLAQPNHKQDALFGLGSIAWRQGDTNTMVDYYQRFLTNNFVPDRQYQIVTNRLKGLLDE